LINHPTNERIVVLTCVVTASGCTYIVTKEIKVGDRDCCTSLSDIENNTYTAHRFGNAGCWMTENLAVTKNEKQGSAAYLSEENGKDQYAPRYTRPATENDINKQISLDNARNSDFYGTGVGKPGLLYNWAAAVGARTASNATNTTAGYYPNVGDAYTLGDASKSTSKDEDICPVGWYLPSDAEWYELENEIHKNYGKYSKVSGTNTGDVPIYPVNNYLGTHGRYMRALNDTPRGSAGSPAGVSNSKESGFNGLLVGYANSNSWYEYGFYAYYWSSSSYSSSNAWRRTLYCDNAGVNRGTYEKYHLRSVRCKKLDY
jgi:uncharacterized protein (TIGR02145 family)